MTLLETTYRQFRSAGLVHCAEAFSREYLGKNSNWYAYQKHLGRDYSVGAAIQCLRSIRHHLAKPSLGLTKRKTLIATETQLLMHLSEVHMIADVC
jgi:hypothetical protein